MSEQFCIIDTETSGLFDWSRPADAEGQPRLASLALILLRGDLSLEAEIGVLVRPEGWSMGEDAQRVHGLSNERLLKEGIPVRYALALYLTALNEGRVIVAHNTQYDTKIMRGELRRLGLPDEHERTRTICTMRSLTDVCKLPKARGGYKFPRLSEACEIVLSRPHVDAHGALPDARACVDLFRVMRERGFEVAA